MSLQYKLYWNTFLPIISQGFRFVISIAVARLLMPKDFGIVSISMMAVVYANTITNFGFNQAIIQKKIKDFKLINSIFTVDIIISAFFLFFFLSFANYMAVFFELPEAENAIKVLSCMFIITTFHGVANSILSRDMEFKIISSMNFLLTVLGSVLTLSLAWSGFGFWALIYGQIIPLALVTIFLCAKAKWIPSICYSHQLMRSVYDFGLWNFIKSQLQFFGQYIDKAVAAKALGAHSLGLYDKAMSISVMPLEAVTMNMNTVFFASFSKNKDDKLELKSKFTKALALISMINLPVYMGLISIAPYFVDVLLGEQWTAMTIPFQIILFASIFKSFGGVISSLNVGMGNYKKHTLCSLTSVTAFVLFIFLLLKLKLVGLAIAYLLYCILMPFLTMRLACSAIGLNWGEIFFAIRSGLIGSLLMFAGVLTISVYFLNDFTFTNLSLLACLGGLFYLGFIALDNNSYSRELKGKILSDISRITGSLKGKGTN